MAETLDPGQLLDQLRQERRTRSEKPAPVSARKAPPESGRRAPPLDAPSFRDLEGYDQMRLMKAASEQFDLASPFFRTIDAVRGTMARIGGQWVSNFASYDYLGLNQEPAIRSAAQTAIDQWGVSANASRLVGGDKRFHGELEARLAALYQVDAALAMVSGHATNVSVVRTLVGAGDLVLMDALIHNSVAEGVRASGAAHLTFPHNDVDWIDRRLAACRDQYRHVLIVTEGLYSMDGDRPDLPRLTEIKSRHCAWLMVDEAHALGVLGETGRGSAEAHGIAGTDVDIWMGTLSKTLSSCGGYIAGSSVLIDYLRFKCPGFVYSVGLSAPNAAAASAAIDAMHNAPERVATLRDNGALFRRLAQDAGLDTGLSEGHAITPVVVGDSMRAVIVADQLLQAGFNVLPILFPAVPEKAARLRFFLTSGHDEQQIRDVIAATTAAMTMASTWNFRK